MQGAGLGQKGVWGVMVSGEGVALVILSLWKEGSAQSVVSLRGGSTEARIFPTLPDFGSMLCNVVRVFYLFFVAGVSGS